MISPYHRSDAHKKKFKKPNSRDIFRREKLDVTAVTPLQRFAMVFGLVTNFNALAPFAHAAEPDNQNTANTVVNMKSCNNKKKLQLLYVYSVEDILNLAVYLTVYVEVFHFD